MNKVAYHIASHHKFIHVADINSRFIYIEGVDAEASLTIVDHAGELIPAAWGFVNDNINEGVYPIDSFPHSLHPNNISKAPNVSLKWQKRFMQMATMCAGWSKDPSTQVGAVISRGNNFISMGFNGYAKGVEDKIDTRDVKYMKVIHAEENAILQSNQSIAGASIFATHFPCPNCCAKIIQKDITEIYVPVQSEDYLSRWGDKTKISMGMIEEVGIRVIYVKDFEPTATTLPNACDHSH